MSAPVDVLAVIDNEAFFAGQCSRNAAANRLLEARAAVAELIAENERLRRALRPATAESFHQAVAEHEAALATGGTP